MPAARAGPPAALALVLLALAPPGLAAPQAARPAPAGGLRLTPQQPDRLELSYEHGGDLRLLGGRRSHFHDSGRACSHRAPRHGTCRRP